MEQLVHKTQSDSEWRQGHGHGVSMGPELGLVWLCCVMEGSNRGETASPRALCLESGA